MWTFRATYDVPELGILRGDGIKVRRDLSILVYRERSLEAIQDHLRHLMRYPLLRGPGFPRLLEARARLRLPDGRHLRVVE